MSVVLYHFSSKGELVQAMVSESFVSVETLDGLAMVLRALRRLDARRRGGKRWTVRELVTKTDMPRSTIDAYLQGHRLVPTDKLDRLVTALGACPAEQHAFATARDRVDRSAEARLRAWPVQGVRLE